MIGLESTGLHTNGYSLARKIIFEKLGLSINSYVPELSTTVAEALLTIHKSYYPELRKYAQPELIHGMAHITGGGLVGNLKRIIPNHLTAQIDCQTWECPPLFQWLVKEGEVPLEDAYAAFNMGIGLVIIVSADHAQEIFTATRGKIIGKIKKRVNTDSVILNF